MEDQVQVKLEFENALRRATVARDETLQGFKRVVCGLLALDACDVTYVDEEGDLITVGSDLEFHQLVGAALKDKRMLRFRIQPAGAASAAEDKQEPGPAQEAAAAAEEEEEEPDFPFANLARALSDPETVQRLQAALQSPVLTEATAQFARAYVESRGDAAVAGLVASQHFPALLALFAELAEELPVAKDLHELIFQQCAAAATGCEGPCGGGRGRFGAWRRGRGRFGPFGGHHHGGPFGHGPFGHGPFGHGPHPGGPFGHPPHPGGPFGHPPHPGGPFGHGPFGGGHHHPRGPFGGHPGVLCDGCASDEALKAVAAREGHLTHRGFIRGTRFKSNTVNDFDLCESCKRNTARFPDSAYGPFTEIAPPNPWEHRGHRWGWHRHHHGAPGGAPWRSPQERPASPAGGWFDSVENFFKGLRSGQKEGEVADIAQAIAESLRESGAPAKTDKPDNVPVATEVKPSEAAAAVAQPPATPTKKQEQDPFVKWSQQLTQLQTLGFDRLETYIDFLEEEKGDLERVVNRIVRRDM